MTAAQIIQQIEAAGGILVLNGDRIRYDVPTEAASLMDVLRQHRDEVLRVPRGRRDAAKRQISRWMAVRCAPSERVWGSEKSLYRDYLVWCDQHSQARYSEELFGGILDEAFHREGNGWQGLCLAVDFMACKGLGRKSPFTQPLVTARVQ